MGAQSQRIGDRFEIGDPQRDLLGQGVMGDVYRGIDTHTNQPVAIKVLKADMVASDPDIVTRFVREGKALRQLNHPNIVKMVDALQDADAGRHYLVMEYVSGGSLRDALDREEKLPLDRVVGISLDLADALTRAHRLGIIHRDLKPANVLLAEDGTPRLSDFGHALLVASPRLTQTGTLMGSVGYLCPEACNGETLDNRGDIWAFGVMLYEMLTGELPFVGETLIAVVTAILTQPVPDLEALCPDAPAALVDLVYRMLEKDPQARIPSVRLVGAELEAVLASMSGQPHLHSPQSGISDAQAQVPAVSYQTTTGRFATPTSSIEGRKHNLPAQATLFVGREEELAELNRLLADPGVRLVTVVGPGGIGKTRLALQAVERQLNRFADGVFFVSLAPLQSIEAIVPAIAQALGFAFYKGDVPRQQLLDHLREKRMLLLLDNFEHLLAGVDIATEVLRIAPNVKVLATSRARLSVQGEQLFFLSGMDFPDWETAEDALEYTAVKLFMQSARRVRPGFELQVDDLHYIARICRLVGGTPLGILLAAAWVEMLTPEEIAAEIERSLDFLETDLRDVPERHTSVRAVFDHSWNLLTEREQEVFRGLAVFCGGFTRQAAQQVTGATLRGLMALVSKSLLHRTPMGRYEIHELLRQYAAEKLDASAGTGQTVRDRHAAYYAAALQRWAADLRCARQQTAMAEMRADSENARAAWEWAIERGQVEYIEQALEGLSQYYAMNERQQEGESTCRMAAQMFEKLTPAASPNERRIWAKVLARQGAHSLALGRTDLASRLMQQSLALLQEPQLAGQDTRAERAFVLAAMGSVASSCGEMEKAWQLYDQSLALYRTLGDRWRTAEVLYFIGYRARNVSNYRKARQLAQESLALYRALGDRWKMAGVLYLLSSIARAQGRLEEAERLAQEETSIRRESGLESASGIAQATRLQQLGLAAWPQGQLEKAERLLREAIATRLETNPESVKGHEHVKAILYLGWTLLLLGRFAEAHALFQEAQAVSEETGRRHQQGFSLSDLGFAKLHLGQYEEARAQARTSLPLARETGIPALVGRSLHVLGAVALAEGAHPKAHQLLQESVSVYQEMEEQERLGQALAVLGYAARAVGKLHQAERHLSAALRTAVDMEVFRPLIYALPAVALLLVDRGEVERATDLYALASRHPFVANSRWFGDVAGRHIAAATAALPPQVVAATQERGRARDLWATAGELLAELGGCPDGGENK